MFKSVGLAIILILISGTASADLNYACIDPIVEVRGIWIDAGAIPKTAQAIRQMVRSYADANFNLLLPETICRGYAIYPSNIIERDPRFACAIDPLAIMIDEAHKFGIEVHTWVWVFRAGYSKDKGSILRTHPDWAELDINGKDLSPNGGYWLSPSNPSVRDYLACLYAELVRKYPIDGLHLDYIRYETEEKAFYGFSQSSASLFEKQYGVNPANIESGTLDQLFWYKFRERQVNTFMQRIATQTRSIRPNVTISAASGPYAPDARSQLLQNWPNWAANKWVDFITPMSYSTSDDYFKRLILRQKESIGCNALLAEGIGIFVHKDMAQTTTQIAISRQMGASGQILFSASYCDPARLASLKNGPYARPAILPIRDPNAACKILACAAEQRRASGEIELANYYAKAAQSIACYDAARKQKVKYVVPTLPELPLSVNAN